MQQHTQSQTLTIIYTKYYVRTSDIHSHIPNFVKSKFTMHLLYIKANCTKHITGNPRPILLNTHLRLSKWPKVSDDAPTLTSNTQSMAFNDHVMYEDVEYRTALYRLFVFLFLDLQYPQIPSRSPMETMTPPKIIPVFVKVGMAL